MSMQQRESNSGTLTTRMYKTTNGKRETHTQHLKSRQVASEQKWFTEQTHYTFHAVRKFNRLWETMISLNTLTTVRTI